MARQMRLFLVVLMSLGAAVMNAQVTTSAMSGHVSDELGEDVISALVRVVHQPSGTTYSAITNTDGRWAIQGMRVGGPYEVEITYIGYADKIIDDITLQLGETYNINVSLSENITELGEVVVNFGDDVLISDNDVSPWTASGRGGSSKVIDPDLNNKYFNGWFKIQIAPIKTQ